MESINTTTNWIQFLEDLCQRDEHRLTRLETEVVLCLREIPGQTKADLLDAYIQSYSYIEEEAFTQRLKNIYKKFQVHGPGQKLPQLHKFVHNHYHKLRNHNGFFDSVGLRHVYSQFPKERFGEAIDQLMAGNDQQPKEVDILQTFAPNLDDYAPHLGRCLDQGIRVRILLAWPFSEAAKLREMVLKMYGDGSIEAEISIRERVFANLETLEQIIKVSKKPELMEIKLYDTLPSLAIYRSGNYMLAAPFLHGSLAVNTFQLELSLDSSNHLITQTLRQDFELMWSVARLFSPEPSTSWRNNLKILFTN
jgi:hypothetical protein